MSAQPCHVPPAPPGWVWTRDADGFPALLRVHGEPKDHRGWLARDISSLLRCLLAVFLTACVVLAAHGVPFIEIPALLLGTN